MHHSKHGNVDVLAGDEPLTDETASQLDELFERRARVGQPHVVLDLSHVPFVDSAGLERLLDLRDRCLERGGRLKLAGPNHLVRDVLRLTEVADRFETYPSAVAAAGSFAR
jgi:anti-sigma B factor antagonist